MSWRHSLRSLFAAMPSPPAYARKIDPNVSRQTHHLSNISAMDKQAFFWKVVAGELPIPKAADTLGIVFKHIDAEAGTIEIEVQGK